MIMAPATVSRLQLSRSGSLICRNEDFLLTHMYAANGILTHDILTLSAITARAFPIFLIGNQIAEYAHMRTREGALLPMRLLANSVPGTGYCTAGR